MRSARVVLLLVSLYPGAPLTGQDTGLVSGRVTDALTGTGISNARVWIVDGSETRSDTAGWYRLESVGVGSRTLGVAAIGYRPVVRTNVIVGSGKPLRLDVALTRAPVRLADIEVEPDYFPRTRGPSAALVLESEDVRRAPGVSEDVLRSVSLLPGVGVTTAGRNDLAVRGGAPFENLFVVDGIEVPNLNHFGSQGSTGGPLTLINVDFVESVRFAAGPSSVRYGDRTASVTDITLRRGSREGFSGEVTVSATGFGAMAEGPLGRSASFFLGVRRSYLDLLFRAAGFSFVPAYWDGQFKVAGELGSGQTVEVFAIGAVDFVTLFNRDPEDRFDNSRILVPEQEQLIGGATWRRAFEDALLTVSLGTTMTRFRTSQSDSLDPPVTLLDNDSREGARQLRVDLRWSPAPRWTLRFGTVGRWSEGLRYDVRIDGVLRRDANGSPSPLSADTSLSVLDLAGYAEATWETGDGVEVTAGVRQNRYGAVDAWRVDPRVGITVRRGVMEWRASAGRVHQPPSTIWLVGAPGNRSRLEPIASDQVVLGWAATPWEDVRVQVEAFGRWYRDYPARVFRPQAVLAPSGFEDATTDIPFGLEPLVSAGSGRSIGVEIVAQKRLARVPVYGLASVTVARATFRSLDGVRRPGSFDTRLIGNLLAGYRPNAAWEFSAKFRVATGRPYTPITTTGPDAGTLDFTRYNAERLPAFHALDVRVDRRWSLGGVQLDLYVDVQNAYGRPNVSAFRWNAREGTIEADESLGVLPSLGVNLEF